MVLGVTYEGSKELNAVSMLTGVFFGMGFDVPSARRNLGGTHRRHSGTAGLTAFLSVTPAKKLWSTNR